MTNWSHGYDVSLGYTHGFYRETGPDWLDLCARVSGYVPPRRGADGGFRYLELGTGQGVGLCLLAAANPAGEFTGIDFIPEHIAHAEELADSAGLTNVRFLEADFAELAQVWPENLGRFDYVALHGVYSWVSPALRSALVRCLHHATRPRSLVYNAYNAQPGWVSTQPFQHLTRQLKAATGLPGPSVFDESIKLFDRLRAAEAGIFQVLPALGARVDSVKGRDGHYLVQEYLHDAWHPLWHSEVAREFAAAKLGYVGSATMAETMLPGMLPPALRDIVAEQQDGTLRQDLQDLVINQAFRRDLFCRGPRRSVERGIDAAAGVPLHLIAAPADGVLKVGTAFGELTLQHMAFAPIVTALGDGSMTIGDLAALPAMRQQGTGATIQMLLLLLHSGALAVGAAEPASTPTAQRLNAAIAAAAAKGMPYLHVASAALGAALPVTDIDLMLIDAWLATGAAANTATLADGVARRLTRLDRKLHRDGQPVDEAGARPQLEELAGNFLAKDLPRLRQLGALA